MSDQFLWFLAGSIAGFFVNWLSTALYPSVQRLYRRLLRKMGIGVLPPIPSPERLSVGGMVINWIVLARAHYVPGRIQCYYDNQPIPLVPDFARMLEDYTRDCNERLDRGESGVPFNGPLYKLKEFDVGYREIIEGEEVPVLRLWFGPTDYYTQAVTDLNTGNPVRERYAKATDITVKPVPEFASITGVGINLITKDNYLVVPERSPRTYVAGGKFVNTIGENLLRPTDANPEGAPDPFRCALRGAREEIGVVLNYQDVKFTAFGVHPALCQYSLMGTVRIKETKDQVLALRRLAVPKDKWESSRQWFVRFTPDDIAQFIISRLDHWHHWGIAAAVLSLLEEGYSERVVNEAFLRARSKMGEGRGLNRSR